MMQILEQQITELKKMVEQGFARINENMLLQDEKIARLENQFNSQLRSSIYNTVQGMKGSGELDNLITDAVLNELNTTVGVSELEYEDVSQQCIAHEAIHISTFQDVEKDTSYIVAEINGLTPAILQTNGMTTAPLENRKNILDFQKIYKYPYAINAGLHGVTMTEGEIAVDANAEENEGWYILGITADGFLRHYPRTYTATAVKEDGCICACNIWTPLIVDGVPFNPVNIPQDDPNYDYIITQKHPRQMIGQKVDGTYVVCTIDGRAVGESGVDFWQLRSIAQAIGCVTAYNLDGGASTQTCARDLQINRRLSDSRRPATAIVFREVM